MQGLFNSANSNLDTLPELRWELFRHKNLEGEKLPPTRGTLLPHILCTNYILMRDKSYITAKPVLLALEINGWNLGSEGVYRPTMCLKDPAPKAVLVLVKCGCHGSFVTTSCSCLRTGLCCMVYVNVQTVQMLPSFILKTSRILTYRA